MSTCQSQKRQSQFELWLSLLVVDNFPACFSSPSGFSPLRFPSQRSNISHLPQIGLALGHNVMARLKSSDFNALAMTQQWSCSEWSHTHPLKLLYGQLKSPAKHKKSKLYKEGKCKSIAFIKCCQLEQAKEQKNFVAKGGGGEAVPKQKPSQGTKNLWQQLTSKCECHPGRITTQMLRQSLSNTLP